MVSLFHIVVLFPACCLGGLFPYDFHVTRPLDIVFDNVVLEDKSASFWVMAGMEVMSYFAVLGQPPSLIWTTPDMDFTYLQTMEDENEMIIHGMETSLESFHEVFDDLQPEIVSSEQWSLLPNVSYSLAHTIGEIFNFENPASMTASNWLSIFSPIHRLATVAADIGAAAVEEYLCSTPANNIATCPWGWKTIARLTNATIYDPTTDTYVTAGGECNGMCGPACCCWKHVCGDCCMRPNCLFHDVVSCKDGIKTFRCWKDGLTMLVASNHSIFGLSCDYDSWTPFDPDSVMMNSWIGNQMMTHNAGIRRKILDLLESRAMDRQGVEVLSRGPTTQGRVSLTDRIIDALSEHILT